MKPESQRIAIAEACGWKRHPKGSWADPDGFFRTTNSMLNFKAGELPDYLNDLNAMHEAVKFCITDMMWDRYICNLRCACSSKWTEATASQRAEAFLKTIGKWEPTETKVGEEVIAIPNKIEEPK